MDNLDDIAKQITAVTGVNITKDDPIIASYALIKTFLDNNNKIQIEHLNKLIANSDNLDGAIHNLCKAMLMNSEKLDRFRSENSSNLEELKVKIQENNNNEERRKINSIAIYGALLFSVLSFTMILKLMYF